MSIVPGRDVPEVPEEWTDAVNKAINDENHEDLCMCGGWPTACASGYKAGQWDFGVDLTIAVGVLEPLIRAWVAEHPIVELGPEGPSNPDWDNPGSARWTGIEPDPGARQATEFRLTLTESKGPHEGSEVDTGAPTESGQPCPGCDEIPLAGDTVTKLAGSWWHAHCAATMLRKGGVDEAWTMLGQSLAVRPSQFSTTETRAIVRNLLRINGAQAIAQPVAWRTQ